MPFRLPTFNLTANIWRYPSTMRNYATPDVVTLCNLTPGRRSFLGITTPSITTPAPRLLMELLCPALTDIRPSLNVNPSWDLVEVPAGTFRWYSVVAVDDIGKGFANEHRIALLAMTCGSATFLDVGNVPYPTPIP